MARTGALTYQFRHIVGWPDNVSVGAILRPVSWAYLAVLAAYSTGRLLAPRQDMRQPLEVLLGRGAACCLHPWAAWRLRSRAVQWGIAGAYALAAYVVVLVSLVAF